MRVRDRHWPVVFEISHWGKAGVRYWKEYLVDAWEKGLPNTTALDRFAGERWPLSLHKRSVEEEIGTFPPMYRWLLAAYRFELATIRRLLEKDALPVADGPMRIPGPREMRVLYPLR